MPSTISLTLVDANGGAPLPGAAVYLWHCDAEGRYSLYSQGVTNENYLRGVQEADSNGVVTFTSVYPACYSGRWPHIHYEVYPDARRRHDGLEPAGHLAARVDRGSERRASTPRDTVSARAPRTCRRSAWRPTWCSAMAPSWKRPTITGSVADGYTIAMTAAIAT